MSKTQLTCTNLSFGRRPVPTGHPLTPLDHGSLELGKEIAGHGGVGIFLGPGNLLARLVEIEQPHVLVDVLADVGVAPGAQVQADAVGVFVLDQVVDGT